MKSTPLSNNSTSFISLNSQSFLSAGYSSGYGGHSGFDNKASHSGHSGYDEPCCPLVLDPLLLFAMLGAIAAATYFLRSKHNFF